jgi:glucose-6-phosphate 1-epimerase
MLTIDQLNSHFSLPGVARFDAGKRDMPRLVITTPAAEAHIYLHGAHVTHFQPRGGKPLLFLSSQSHFDAGKPIRGGVPVIFPWFGPRGSDTGVSPVRATTAPAGTASSAPSPMHGFVRLQQWKVESVEPADNDGVKAVFAFDSTPETREIWDHAFALRFTAIVTRELTMQLEVINRSDAPFTFTEALHTYFAVGDVRNVNVDGLGNADYLDKNQNHKRVRQEEPTLNLFAPTDRVYQDTTSTVTIDDKANGRRITVAKENSRSTVVWNPWEGSTMPDLDPAEWTRFLCVETANVRDHAVTLAAGARHTMTARVSVS